MGESKNFLFMIALTTAVLMIGCDLGAITDIFSDDSSVSVTGISLDPDNVTLAVGDTKQLQALVEPDNASNKKVSWESSNGAVATVSAAGLLAGIAPGSTVITVLTQDDNYSDTCTVTVTAGGNNPNTGPVTGSTPETGTIDKRNFAVSYGYDIYGEWADPFSVKSKILDYDLLESEGKLTYQTIAGNLEENICEGSTEESYLKNLDVEASVSGHYLMYYGEVSTNFNMSNYSSNKHSFATYYGELKKQLVRIEPSYCYSNTLAPYLTEEAKAAINGTNPLYASTDEGIANLFRDFGTHVILKAYRGARINYRAKCDMTTVGGSKTIGAYIKAGFEMGIAGAELNTSIVKQEQWDSFEENAEISISQQGGNTELTTLSNYSSWKTGVEDNPARWTLMAFETSAAEKGFIPIWEFAPTLSMMDIFGHFMPSRQDKIKEYFEQEWSEERSKPVTLPLTYGTLKIRLRWLNNNSIYDQGDDRPEFRWRIRAEIGGNINMQKDLSDTTDPNIIPDDILIDRGYCVMFADEANGGFSQHGTPADTFAEHEFTIFNTKLLNSTGTLVINLELAEIDKMPWDHGDNEIIARFGYPAFYFKYDQTTDRWSFEKIVNAPSFTEDAFQVINPQVRSRGAGEAKHRLHLPFKNNESMELVLGLVWE